MGTNVDPDKLLLSDDLDRYKRGFVCVDVLYPSQQFFSHVRILTRGPQ